MDFSWASHDKASHDNTTAAGKEDVCGPGNDFGPLPAVRTVFSVALTTVYGWPSTGGVWTRDCDAIELDFLGLPRFEPSPTQTFSKEDNHFYQRLEWIGARFHESDSSYQVQTLTTEFHKIHSWYGWPAAVSDGGVWALWTRGIEPSILQTGRIGNALTMQEICQAIEMLGGRFYSKWEDALKEFESQSNKTARLIATDNAEALRASNRNP